VENCLWKRIWTDCGMNKYQNESLSGRTRRRKNILKWILRILNWRKYAGLIWL
jgi:hypothetical protein